MKSTTEQINANSKDIDKLSTANMLALINDEDAYVAITVRRAIPQIAAAVELIVESLRNGGHLLYVGAGTSGRLGVLDAAECVPTFSVSPNLVQGVIAGGEEAMLHSIEGAEDSAEQGALDLANCHLSEHDVVCGIAASGRTPFVLGALRYANSIGAKTIAISSNANAPILKAADVAIVAEVGPEVIAGSTRMKAGTAQKMILNMLSTASMIKLGKVYGNLMVDVKVTNQKLAERASRLVMQLTDCDATQANALLTSADNQVKTAVVMGRLGVDVQSARKLLGEANGHLRSVIGDVVLSNA